MNIKIKAMSDKLQFHQEMGGLAGRVLLAGLLSDVIYAILDPRVRVT